jgi:hypothetical protein
VDDLSLTSAEGVSVAEYCRRVEEHLARVNAGHLVRVVGPAFLLVKSWAERGVPFSVVCRGIDRKAERHRKGRSTRPLRLEFCEDDVREEFEEWRRAVGVTGSAELVSSAVADSTDETPRAPTPKGQSGKALDRAIDRLVRVSSHLDASEEFRTDVSAVLDRVVEVRERLRKARGDARAPFLASLDLIHADLVAVARRVAGDVVAEAEAEASADLAPYRTRLGAEVWRRSVTAAADRIVLERLGLPTLLSDVAAGGGD